jgi:hypothetical protein
MTASASSCVEDRELFGATPSLFDDDHLAPAVVATIRTDVMIHVRLAAGVAGHQDRHVLDEIVPAPVSLAVAGDSLFWQRSHR